MSSFEKKNPFVITEEERAHILRAEKTPETLLVYALRHMLDDLTLFSEEEASLVKRAAEIGVDTLSTQERSRFHEIHDAWWQVIDPTLSSRESRKQYIKDHAIASEIKEPYKLEKTLHAAIASGDTQEIKNAKDAYLESFPQEQEGITILFDFISFIQDEQRVDEMHEKNIGIHPEIFKKLAGYQGELTKYIIGQSDRNFLERFWQGMARISGVMEGIEMFQRFKNGILTQIAAYKLFSHLEYQTDIATPEQDAINSVDLWVYKGKRKRHAVQVKSSADAFDIIPSDEVALPGIQVQQDGMRTHYNTPDFASIQKSVLKAARYAEETHTRFSSYYIILPLDHIDEITGEPDEVLIQMARERLGISGNSTRSRVAV